MNHIGDPTLEESIAYFDKIIKKDRNRIDELLKLRDRLLYILEDLCANAEPVCDSLEMGQSLKAEKTLTDFRVALDAGWKIVMENGDPC